MRPRDLEPFHSIEQYQVSNPQYQVSSLLENCDFFVFFLPKKLYLKAKTHIFEVEEPKLPPPLI